MRHQALLLLFLVASPVLAQDDTGLRGFGLLISGQSRPSFTLIGAGARAAGMGGAFTALADDASAASFNPAGLALLIKPEVSLVLDGQSRSDAFPQFTNSETGVTDYYSGSQTSFDTQGLNFASFTVPVRVAARNLCLQLSYHRQIEFDAAGSRRFEESLAPGGEPFARYLQEVDQSGEIYTLSLAAAYQLTQRLSLGASLSKWSGSWRFSTLDSENDLPDNRVDTLRYVQDNDLSGWSWNVGLLLRYRYLNVGVLYRLGFDADYRFASTVETNVPTPLVSEPRSSHTLRWPTSTTIGLAIKPTDTWHLTVDYARFPWSDMELRELGLNFFDLRPSSATRTPDVEHWRFGTELTVFAGRRPISLRAGYFLEPQPLGNAVDARIDLSGYSAGIGVALGKVRLDVAYQRRSGSAAIQQLIDPSIVATGTIQGQAVGDFEITDERVFAAFLYQMSSTGALKKAFHFLFVGPRKKGGDRGHDG